MSTPDQPQHRSDSMVSDELLHMRITIIPFMLERIAAACHALELEKRHGILDYVELFRAGTQDERLLYTVLGGYTQPVTSIAAIQCRVLLEFLGLTTSKATPGRLASVREKRRVGDIGIECYADREGNQFKRLTRDCALALVHGPIRAECAWTTVIEFANQRLAHATDDHRLGGKSVRPHLYNAFRTVPRLVENAFLDQLE